MQPVVRQVPFLNSHILQCWSEGFDEPTSRLHVMLLRRDGELVAGLPLYRARGRYRSLSRAHADSIDVVAVGDEDVTAQLPIWADSLTVAHLYRLREDSPLVTSLPAHPRWSVQSVLKSPYVDLSSGMDQVRQGLSKEFHRTLRRRRRRLTELGDVTFVDHPPPNQVESVLNEGFRLEAEGWKGEKGVAVLNLPTHERWFRSVGEVAEDHGWLRLSSLNLDGRMLAFRYDLHYGEKRYGMISSYDESPDLSFSTGSLLLESVLEQSAADAVRTYEFGYGNHPWKYDWTSDEHRVYDLLIFGSGFTGRAVAGAKRLRDLGRHAEPVVVGSAQG